MLMAPGPSSWAAGATGSRSPVGVEENIDPEVAPPAAGASEEVLRAARLQARAANALDSSPIERDSQSAMRMHGPACMSRGPTWCLHCGERPARRHKPGRGRRPRGRWSSGRRRAATAQRWALPSRRLGGCSRAPSGSPPRSAGWPSIYRARRAPRRADGGRYNFSTYVIWQATTVVTPRAQSICKPIGHAHVHIPRADHFA